MKILAKLSIVKSNRKTICVNFLFLLIFQCLYSQVEVLNAESILTKSKSYYENNPNFQASLEYTLFRSPDQPIVIDRYSGKMIKNNQDLYLKIHQTEFFINHNNYLKINHEEKAMEYKKLMTRSDLKQNPIEVYSYLKYFSEQEVCETDSFWICKLITPKYTQLSYASITFYIDKNNYEVRKQVIELMAPGSIRDEKGNYSVDRKFLETKIKSDKKHDFEVPEISNYISSRDGYMKPAKDYESYEFFNR